MVWKVCKLHCAAHHCHCFNHMQLLFRASTKKISFNRITKLLLFCVCVCVHAVYMLHITFHIATLSYTEKSRPSSQPKSFDRCIQQILMLRGTFRYNKLYRLICTAALQHSLRQPKWCFDQNMHLIAEKKTKKNYCYRIWDWYFIHFLLYWFVFLAFVMCILLKCFDNRLFVCARVLFVSNLFSFFIIDFYCLKNKIPRSKLFS